MRTPLIEARDGSDARVRTYLAGIGIEEPVARDVDGLERLQRAHLTRVPFENLDIVAGQKVRTDTDWSLPKITRGRCSDKDRGRVAVAMCGSIPVAGGSETRPVYVGPLDRAEPLANPARACEGGLLE